MKKVLFLLGTLLAGLGAGGGAAYATVSIMGPAKPGAHAAEDTTPPSFVDGGKVLAPLVFADGRLSGYVQFQLQLEVAQDKVDTVSARLPLLLHAINMRTFKTPMAAGVDGQLPDVEAFRKVVMAAAPEAFGAGIVKKVAITAATPA
ncbi:hypothetical protein LQ953_09515 [Sphingomonas sp. IC-56]|uniref:hypothetical protein n=1 Tax=Sphingomonas sp. IC-56 TaxID=2898529 RepID=UPI001E4AEAAD|nr:hypothetical protein [Sphingomonas sp. IC-56]MCD2324249.1 hypothetical protein [Sphingomonas sp. IC-56]